MTYSLVYHHDVPTDDLPLIPRDVRERIRRAIEARLTSAPADYGKPLRHSLKSLWSLRMGDYRVVYQIRAHEILILKIGHRRDVYEQIHSRLK